MKKVLFGAAGGVIAGSVAYRYGTEFYVDTKIRSVDSSHIRFYDESTTDGLHFGTTLTTKSTIETYDDNRYNIRQPYYKQLFSSTYKPFKTPVGTDCRLTCYGFNLPAVGLIPRVTSVDEIYVVPNYSSVHTSD